jgi:hypothetical protein
MLHRVHLTMKEARTHNFRGDKKTFEQTSCNMIILTELLLTQGIYHIHVNSLLLVYEIHNKAKYS